MPEVVNIYQVANNTSIKELSFFYNRSFLAENLNAITEQHITEQLINGKKVLLKPNWVRHSNSDSDELCLRTHDNFVLEVLHLVLQKKPSQVLIADAPIQGCQWDKMLSKYFLLEIEKLKEKYKIPVIIKDLRRRTFLVSENKIQNELRPLTEYLIFDVGEKSFLEPVTDTGRPRFRVTCYDPERMAEAHKSGTHKYCISKDFFEADVIISLPKIKTHQKTGITGALKNLVGINGDKDFLPHHRLGGTELGGDCYPGGSMLRYAAELVLDKANRRQGKETYWFWQKLSALLWKLSLPNSEQRIDAGWYGNDTTWRMVMDLNMIAYYGKTDGTFSDKKQRVIYSVCDGIIAGQGNGPLQPEPLNLGVISFSDNPALNDIAMAILMGFDYNKFPLLKEAARFFKTDTCHVIFNGERTHLNDLKKYSVFTKPPVGWKSHLINK